MKTFHGDLRPVGKTLLCLLCCGMLLWPMPCPAHAGADAAKREAFSPAEREGASSADTSETLQAYGTLQKGSSGEAVRRMQQRLSELGYDPGGADGIFGEATRTAVQAFQRRNGLDADGIAGPLTQARLFSPDAVPAPEPTNVLNEAWPMLVNRDHPVDEDFIPADLVPLTELCDPKLVRIKYSSTRGVREAVEALVTMLEAAQKDKVTKWQVSAGYRSWSDQETVLNNKINHYLNKNSGWSRSRALSAALRTVAEPGTSEHHLGLAFDVNVPGASNFSSTRQCKWLHKHCWEYGFIVRYQKEKESITGFTAEAWHIRYVGTVHSLTIRDLGLCLEEYLGLAEAGEIQLEEVEEVNLDEAESDLSG